MKMSLYSVYDNVAKIFNKPFTEINDGTAIRVFIQSLQDNPNRNDYTLYHIADLFDHNGSIQPVEPNKIYTGFDVHDLEEKQPAALTNQAV